MLPNLSNQFIKLFDGDFQCEWNSDILFLFWYYSAKMHEAGNTKHIEFWYIYVGIFSFLVDEGLVSTYVCIYFFSKQTLRTPWVENHPMKALIQAIIVSGAPLLSV